MTDKQPEEKKETPADSLVECSGCHVKKTREEFSRTQLQRRLSKKSNASGNVGYCKKCISAHNRERKYGVSDQALQAMLAAQKGKCALDFCGTFIDSSTAHVDHNHETKAVRGLLCVGCNTGIGKLNDSPETLLEAVLYLARSSSTITPQAKRSMATSVSELTKWLVLVPLKPRMVEVNGGEDAEPDKTKKK